MDQIFFSPTNGVPSESKLATYLVIIWLLCLLDGDCFCCRFWIELGSGRDDPVANRLKVETFHSF